MNDIVVAFPAVFRLSLGGDDVVRWTEDSRQVGEPLGVISETGEGFDFYHTGLVYRIGGMGCKGYLFDLGIVV